MKILILVFNPDYMKTEDVNKLAELISRNYIEAKINTFSITTIPHYSRTAQPLYILEAGDIKK